MFDQATIEMLLEGVVDTLYMTLVSTFFSYVFGMMMGTVLVICRQGRHHAPAHDLRRA